MSIQGMSAVVRPLARPPIVALVAAAVIAGAGAAWALTRFQAPAVTDQARSAQVAAEQARATTDVLTDRLERLQADVGKLELRYERLGERIAHARGDLTAAIQRLKETLAGARSDSRAAGAEAQDALTRVEDAARQLSVLEDRFEYHLRQDHSGG